MKLLAAVFLSMVLVPTLTCAQSEGDVRLAGVTVKSVRVHFGPGGPNVLAVLVRGTKNASIFGPPPDPFC